MRYGQRCVGNTEIPLEKANINIKCSDKFVIYLLGCKHCPAIYVGKTENTLSKRFSKHKSDILNDEESVEYQHFNLPGHKGMKDVWIQGIDKVPGHDVGNELDQKTLSEKESKWIWDLRSNITEYGLNLRIENPPLTLGKPWVYTRGRCTFSFKDQNTVDKGSRDEPNDAAGVSSGDRGIKRTRF